MRGRTSRSLEAWCHTIRTQLRPMSRRHPAAVQRGNDAAARHRNIVALCISICWRSYACILADHPGNGREDFWWQERAFTARPATETSAVTDQKVSIRHAPNSFRISSGAVSSGAQVTRDGTPRCSPGASRAHAIFRPDPWLPEGRRRSSPGAPRSAFRGRF